MGNSTTATINIKAVFDNSDVVKGAQQIQNAFKNIKVSDTLQSDFNKAFSNLENSVNKVQQKYEQGFKTKGDVSSYEKAFKEMENAATQYEKVVQRIQTEVGSSVDLSKLIKWDDSTLGKLKEVENEIARLKQQLQFNTNSSALSKVEQALSGIKSTAPATSAAIEKFKTALSDGDLEGASEALQKLDNIWKRFGEDNTNTQAVNSLKEAFDELTKSDVFSKLKEQFQAKGLIQTEAWQKLVTIFQNGGNAANLFSTKVGQAKDNLIGAINAQQAWNSSVDQFKSRIQYFFGLNNVIQLIRRSLREALNTVKELDAAMAQTAVVTNFTIADMWDQLPKYTEVANQLGVTTKGAYETMTLFYQQGLDTNQTFAIGTETMKMARIAGIDYATATDYMTAALRGFNMELDELSAQRVNDVYSRLAAITASNTQEISTAMTKVASLAHNANMEFETTSAFLAQIIETTRESAETAGTALKTVVARFSEVKKMINTNQLTGTDSEGEVIDVNRVSAALRTAGIDMNKYFLGEVGLDDIFMELASKWDSLTSVQQRYIATQAAGSRQQSRFIAMMSNYARTQELVQEAYNSTGASEKQFEKTQASLETALNRLNNAWDQFTMNLANNDAIKTAVNTLTELLNVLNGITGVFGSGWRTMMTAGLGLGALFGGGRLTNAAFSASKIARANAKLSWGQAFKAQLGRNPYTYNQATGELGDRATRFHLFGQGGFFSPYDTEWNGKTITNDEDWKKAQAAYKLQQRRRGGGITAGVGLALSAGGSAIQQNAESIAKSFDTSTESVQKFGEKMSTLGTTASVAGSMLMLLPGPLGIIAAAITGLIGLIVAFRGETQGELLTRLSDETENAAAAAKSAKEAYDDLLSGAAAHDELLDKISNLKEGTLEFREAILEANQAALDLIENYNLPSDSYTRNNNGLIMFNPGAIEQAQEKQLNLAEKAAKNASVAKLVESAELNLSDNDYNLEEELKTISEDTSKRIVNDLATDNLTELWGGSRGNIFTVKALQEAAQAAGYETNYADYIKGVQSGITTKSIRGQEDYRSTLYDLAGTNLTDATKLAIDQLASQYNAEEISQIRHDAESKYKGYTDEQLKADYRKYIGPIAKDLEIDDIKDALIHNTEATKLNTKLAEAQKEIDAKATTQAKRFSKTSLSKILQGAKSDNIYDQLAARSAQNTLASTQRKVAEFTDLPVNLQFGSFTTEQTEQIGNIAESFGKTFGSKASTLVVGAINNELVKSKNSPLLTALKGINFSGVASTDLRKIKDLGEDYADIFNTAFAEVGGNKGLFESFWYNQGEVLENLDKIAQSEGKISGDNILDAANDCQELADLLEVSEINAAGLAAALNEIDTGNLDVNTLTEGLLKALSAAEEVNQIIAEADDFLNNWKEEPSGDRFAKWAKGGADSILGAWGAGRYQDQQARQYMSTMLGTDFMREYNKIMVEAGQRASKQGAENAKTFLQQSLGAELDLFQQLSESDNLKPLYDYFEKHGTYADALSNYGIEFKDGMIKFGKDIESAKQAVDALTSAGIDETLANLMVSDFYQNSPDALIEWGTSAAQAGVDAFRKQIADGKIVLKSELDEFNRLYGDLLPEGWADEFQGKVVDLKIDWVNSTDPVQALQDAFDGSKGLQDFLAGKGAFGTQTIGGVKGILDPKSLNLDNLISAFQELGATEAQAMTIAQQYADQTGATFRASYDQWNFVKDTADETGGHWEKTTGYVDNYSNAVDAAAEAQRRAQQSLQEMESKIRQADIAEGVKEGIGSLASEGIEVKFTKDSTEVDEYQPKDKDAKVIFGETHTAVTNYVPENKTAYVDFYPRDHTGGKAATGGKVPAYAKGSENIRLKPGIALTGEEGPELIWNKNQGYAYITGEKHPEFQNLQHGDRVFNAEETKKILQGAATGGKVPAYAIGYLPGLDTNTKKSGGGGGSKSSGSDKEKTPDEWKNELDWLYNLMEDIAELERDQKAIEEQYEDYLKDQSKTGKDLYNLLIKQLGNLYTQLNHQTFALEKREQEMREFMDITNDKDQYLRYNWQDRTIEIDWDAIDKITDEEEYKHVKELVDEAEEIQDKIDDADDAIMDITNQIQELENIWRDTFTDFEDRVYDAIVKSYQQVIDNYSELNDTLNNSNSQILDSLQKQISLQRQIRDNTKTEEEITDDEARLAYLRRDTTGGNDLAALQLEKELADQRQNYEDTLVDQAISRLQEDNDKAAEQRQQQIDIMQAQLDYQSQNGEFNAYVRELLTSAMGADGELLTNSDLVDLLKEQENWAAMSDVSKDVWEEELNGTFKEVAAFILKQNAEENGTFYTALTKAVESVSTAIGSYSQAMTKLGNQISSAASSGGGGGGGGSGGGGSYDYSGKPAQSYGVGTKTASTLAAAAKAAETASRGYGTIAEYTNQLRNKGVKFATGGLSTKTGLAWLDGSPSEPEYVLNARQTDAFLKLADVLPNMMGNGGATSNTFGGSIFNVAVNVDSISSDYDVDRMVDRIKEKLYDDASYRNVNTLSFMR